MDSFFGIRLSAPPGSVVVSGIAVKTPRSVESLPPVSRDAYRRYAIGIIHLDAFGELLPDFATFDW